MSPDCNLPSRTVNHSLTDAGLISTRGLSDDYVRIKSVAMAVTVL